MKEASKSIIWQQQQWNARNAPYAVIQSAPDLYDLFGAQVPRPEVYLGPYPTLEEAQGAAAAHHNRPPKGEEGSWQDATRSSLRKMTGEEMRDAVMFALKDADEEELRHWCNSIFLTGDWERIEPEDEDLAD